MHGEPDEYKLWAWKGEVQTYPINTPIEEAFMNFTRFFGHRVKGIDYIWLQTPLGNNSPRLNGV